MTKVDSLGSLEYESRMVGKIYDIYTKCTEYPSVFIFNHS